MGIFATEEKITIEGVDFTVRALDYETEVKLNKCLLSKMAAADIARIRETLKTGGTESEQIKKLESGLSVDGAMEYQLIQLKSCVVGWSLPEPFDPEKLGRLKPKIAHELIAFIGEISGGVKDGEAKN